MQALKIIVVVMGLLIVIGFAVLVVGLYQKATRFDAEPEAAAAAAAFGTVRLAQPLDAEVLETSATAGRLFVRLRDSTSREWIVVLDLKTGRVLGTIEVHGQP